MLLKDNGKTVLDLQEHFGNIDIYLFDQLLRGRLRPGMTVLDAGCGGGRNLVYLLRNGFDAFAIDEEPEAVDHVRSLAASLAPSLSPDHFTVVPIEALSFPDSYFDFVICNAVLHFARDEQHFTAMLTEIARVLRPGGIFFARLMSTAGIESYVKRIDGGRYRLPDGRTVFLADEPLLRRLTAETFLGTLMDPLKSTIVHNERTMTTWILQRGQSAAGK